jgi:hypothetical protein
MKKEETNDALVVGDRAEPGAALLLLLLKLQLHKLGHVRCHFTGDTVVRAVVVGPHEGRGAQCFFSSSCSSFWPDLPQQLAEGVKARGLLRDIEAVVATLVAQLNAKQRRLRVAQVLQQPPRRGGVPRPGGGPGLGAQGHDVQAEDELVAAVAGERDEGIQGALVQALVP